MSQSAFKIADGFNVEIIKQHLVANPQLFSKYVNRLKATGPHRDSDDIWVRYGDFDKYGDDVFVNEHDSVWYPVLLEIPTVADIAFELMSMVRGERLGGVLITKIPPGGKIYPHTDLDGWHPNYYDKFYVPILNKDGAVFGFDDTNIQGDDPK